MPGRSKLKQGLTQTSKEEGGKTDRSTKAIRDYYSGGKRPISYKKNDRGKIVKIPQLLVGGQAKLDKNKNNRIDAQDFKILKAEKAKGRGQGLQDEKMKPGKVKPVKAVLGLAAMGLMGAKYLKKKNKAMAMPGIGASAMIAKKQKEMLGKKIGGVMKARMGRKIRVKDDDSFDTKMKLQEKGVIDKKTGAGRERITKAMKATKLGKIVLPIAAAGVAASQYLKSKMKKKDKKMGGGMMKRAEGGPAEKSETHKMFMKYGKKVKKMGGGMMKKYNKGGGADMSKKPTSKMKASETVRTYALAQSMKDKDRLTERDIATAKKAVSKKMGGGMMQRPMGGYTSGGSVTVKTKIGKYFPTKTY